MSEFGYSEQMDWAQKRAYKVLWWAQKEYEIRRQAAQALERLYDDEGPDRVNIAVMLPGDGPLGMRFETVTLFKSQVARVGGLEGVLLVEEIIRRAMGLSVEAELEQRLASIKNAL